VPGGTTTSRSFYIPYRNYALVVAIGTVLGIDESAPSLTLAQTAAHAIAMTTDFGAVTLDGMSSIAIPLQGAHAGTLQFSLALGSVGGNSDLGHLDVGMRMYYPTPDTGGSTGATLVTSLSYPLFDPAQGLTLLGTFAPWSVAEDRSFFIFPAATGALKSCY